MHSLKADFPLNRENILLESIKGVLSGKDGRIWQCFSGESACFLQIFIKKLRKVSYSFLSTKHEINFWQRHSHMKRKNYTWQFSGYKINAIENNYLISYLFSYFKTKLKVPYHILGLLQVIRIKNIIETTVLPMKKQWFTISNK